MNRKAIFDAVREFLDRGFTQAEVALLDQAIDRAIGQNLAGGAKGMHTSSEGVALIHGFEDCRLTAYRCSAGRWTIGWGSTTDEAGAPIKPGASWSQERCDARFRQDLAAFEAGVNALLDGAQTSQAQFDALVSFAYNCGLDIDEDSKGEGLGDSTLLRKHKAGEFAGAAAEFAKWNRSGGRVLRGLERRRAAEAGLYRKGST